MMELEKCTMNSENLQFLPERYILKLINTFNGTDNTTLPRMHHHSDLFLPLIDLISWKREHYRTNFSIQVASLRMLVFSESRNHYDDLQSKSLAHVAGCSCMHSVTVET